MTQDRRTPPPGYEISYGGASAEGDYEGGEGWFFTPSNVPNVFYATEAEAVAAAWAQYDADKKA